METTRGAKGVTHSQSAVSVCPAYRFCRELKKSYRSPLPDDYHDQQVIILRDLLQAIKEAALRLAHLMEKRRQADPDLQQRSSEMILANTSSSICALCGVTLHLKNPSKEFVLDGEIIHHDRNITLKDLDSILPAKIPYKAASSTKMEKISDDFVIHVFDHLSPKESDRNIGVFAREQEKKIMADPKIRPVDASEGELKSKLLFVQRIPSEKIAHQIRPHESQRRRDNVTQVLEYADDCCTLQTAGERECKAGEPSKLAKVTRQTPKMASFTISSAQDASTLTNEMFCPCACGLLVGDETIQSRVSIESLTTLKEKLMKTFEDLSFHLSPKKVEHTKARDNVRVTKTIKTRKLEKDKRTEHRKQEIAQLQLQAQVEELHRSIRFFKKENEYIRRLVEEYRYSSGKMSGLQQLLPIRLTYSGFAIAIRLLRAKYCSTHGIIATLTEIVRGSVIVQRITEKLLAPFAEHWHRNTSSAATSSALSASEVEAILEMSSSMTFDVY